jgi:hypothetical protein
MVCWERPHIADIPQLAVICPIRLATRATIPVKYPLPGYFVDLVILRMPAIRLMVMSTRMAGSAGPRPRFNAHRVPCY